MPIQRELQRRANVSADVRRRELADAALRVMKRDGLAAASTRAITTEAGVPHGVFHYCFRSKEELIAEIVRAEAEVNLDDAWAQIGPDDDLSSALRHLMHAYWRHVEDDPEGQLVLLELTNHALREPELADAPRTEHETYLTTLTGHLTRLAEHTETTWDLDLRVLAGMLLAVLDGLTATWLSTRDTPATHAILDAFADSLAARAHPRNG